MHTIRFAVDPHAEWVLAFVCIQRCRAHTGSVAVHCCSIFCIRAASSACMAFSLSLQAALEASSEHASTSAFSESISIIGEEALFRFVEDVTSGGFIIGEAMREARGLQTSISLVCNTQFVRPHIRGQFVVQPWLDGTLFILFGAHSAILPSWCDHLLF